MSEWNLSDKSMRYFPNGAEGDNKPVLFVEDVREFIKKLRVPCRCDNEEHPEWKGSCNGCIFNARLNKLAGNRLI